MTSVGIDVHVEHDRCLELPRAFNGGVEIVDLEPEQHAVADGQVGIAHRAVVVINVPRVQLQDQPVAAPLGVVQLRVAQTLVLGTTVTALATEQAFVESTRGFNVTACNQRLSAHDRKRSARGAQVKGRLGDGSVIFSAACAGCGFGGCYAYNDASAPPPSIAVATELDVLSTSGDGVDIDEPPLSDVLDSEVPDEPLSSTPASGSGGM